MDVRGVEELQDLLASGARLIDALPRREYEDEHLPGAISMPLRDLPRLAASLARDGTIVVYCNDDT